MGRKAKIGSLLAETEETESVEELWKEYSKQELIIATAQQRQHEVLEKIKNADSSAKNWISVSLASSEYQMSTAFIYNRIKAGKLTSKYRGSKQVVSRKELDLIDDRISV